MHRCAWCISMGLFEAYSQLIGPRRPHWETYSGRPQFIWIIFVYLQPGGVEYWLCNPARRSSVLVYSVFVRVVKLLLLKFVGQQHYYTILLKFIDCISVNLWCTWYRLYTWRTALPVIASGTLKETLKGRHVFCCFCFCFVLFLFLFSFFFLLSFSFWTVGPIVDRPTPLQYWVQFI